MYDGFILLGMGYIIIFVGEYELKISSPCVFEET